jgi:hypothetical protein
MLGIILWYFIGKYFADLADDYGKSRWGYAILGVVVYNVGQIIVGIGLFIITDMSDSFEFDFTDQLSTALVGLPSGLLSCYIVYQLLKRNWSKNEVASEEILDQL